MRARYLIPAFLLLAACGPDKLAPITVPLNYTMMADAIEFPVYPVCAGVASVEVIDRRTESEIGTRFLQDGDREVFPVTAGGDVSRWVRTAVDEALRRARVDANANDRPMLSITIDQIVTEESVYRRAEYDARVVLIAELRGETGRSCWRERVDGFAENYGYEGSISNYQETLNHALDRAVIRMLKSRQFEDAVCEPCGPPR